MIRGVLAAAWIVAAASAAVAQRPDSATARPKHDKNQFDSRVVSARLGVALVVDGYGRDQNDGSSVQVGDLPTLGRVRFARGTARGAIQFPHPWQYLLAIDASGLYADDKPALSINDLAITAPLGGHGHVTVGRQKEGITTDIMSPSRFIPFAERAAPVLAFVPTRNDGVRFWGSIPHMHGGWSLGVFNDWLFNDLSFRANGDQVSGRVFYAPVVSDDSNRAVHVALNGRWRDHSNGTLRYKARPEQNVPPNFVNTGSFPAIAGFTADGEFVALRDNVSFNAEILPTIATGTSRGPVNFLAYYAAFSWRPGGEARPYREVTGSIGRVRTAGHRFVWELGARYSRTNLTNKDVQGGVLGISSLSAGVYAHPFTRILLDYGFSVLSKDGVDSGRAQLATLRLQWELR